MALQDLIVSYVPPDLQSRFRLYDGNEYDQSANWIVFVATLWNGKSQLAFKELVKCLERVRTGTIVVLLADDESEYGQSLQEKAPREHWSNGCVFAISNKRCVFLASGIDLNRIDEAINEFSFEQTD